jgi:hypothetical protein
LKEFTALNEHEALFESKIGKKGSKETHPKPLNSLQEYSRQVKRLPVDAPLPHKWKF